MIRNIPIDTSQPDHTFTLDLEGVVYTFRFRLNSRTNVWVMNILTELGELILGAVALVVNQELTKRFGKSSLPPGEMYVVDLSGENKEPEEKSFGVTHMLVYIESTDGTV